MTKQTDDEYADGMLAAIDEAGGTQGFAEFMAEREARRRLGGDEADIAAAAAADRLAREKCGCANCAHLLAMIAPGCGCKVCATVFLGKPWNG